jgi:hypothetical protein
MNPFIPGGTTPTGYGAYPAMQPMNSGLGSLAMMSALSKGFGGSSSSYSSSSSDVSIVKYDDHFGEKDWCFTNLRKPPTASQSVGDKFTQDELKKNPPLALKFGHKDCNVVIPIPSHEAMCKATKAMVSDVIGPSTTASEDLKKKVSDAISKALLYNYVAECNYDDQKLTPACFLAKDLKTSMPTMSQAEQKELFVRNHGAGNPTKAATDYDNAAAGADVNSTGVYKIDPNFKDTISLYR